MRIAVLLRGDLRTFEKTFATLTKAIHGHQFDIFLHTWELTSDEKNSITSIYNPRTLHYGERPSKLQMIEELFSSNDMMQLPQKKIKFKKKCYARMKPSFRYQIYENYCLVKSMKNYMKNTEEYDCVLFTRFDVSFNPKFTETALNYICNSDSEHAFITAYVNKSITDTTFITKFKTALLLQNICMYVSKKTTYSCLINQFLKQKEIERKWCNMFAKILR